MTTNPYVLVNANTRDAEISRLRGNLAGAERVLTDAGAALDKISAELTSNPNGTFNLDSIASIPGSGGEKMQKIVELHSHMAAAQHVINEVRGLEHSAAWRRAGCTDDFAVSPGGGSMAAAVDRAAPHGLGHFSGMASEEVRRVVLPGHPAEVLGANFVTSDGIPVDNRRSNVVAPDTGDYHRPFVTELFGNMVPTEQGSVIFLKETITNAGVAEVAEAAKEAEADISYANETAVIQTIRADIPVSQEQLDDVPLTRSLIDGRLRRLALLRLDNQTLNGNGTAPNIRGLIATTGVKVQKTIKSAADFNGQFVIDEVRDAMASTRSKGMSPASGVALHPAVWAAVQKQQTNGLYNLGQPGVLSAPVLWGLPVAEADSLEDAATDGNNYGMVGDFIGSADIYLRKGITVEAGWIADDFAKYMTRLRVVMRATLATYTPSAFATLQRDVA